MRHEKAAGPLEMGEMVRQLFPEEHAVARERIASTQALELLPDTPDLPSPGAEEDLFDPTEAPTVAMDAPILLPIPKSELLAAPMA